MTFSSMWLILHKPWFLLLSISHSKLMKFLYKLKVDKVVPIFKSGGQKRFCNYRLNSTLPSISKCFEYLAYTLQVYKNYKILGFTTIILPIWRFWASLIVSQKVWIINMIIQLVFGIDLSEAFGSIINSLE